jgi:hypothetical protein
MAGATLAATSRVVAGGYAGAIAMRSPSPPRSPSPDPSGIAAITLARPISGKHDAAEERKTLKVAEEAGAYTRPPFSSA